MVRREKLHQYWLQNEGLHFFKKKMDIKVGLDCLWCSEGDGGNRTVLRRVLFFVLEVNVGFMSQDVNCLTGDIYNPRRSSAEGFRTVVPQSPAHQSWHEACKK